MQCMGTDCRCISACARAPVDLLHSCSAGHAWCGPGRLSIHSHVTEETRTDVGSYTYSNTCSGTCVTHATHETPTVLLLGYRVPLMVYT